MSKEPEIILPKNREGQEQTITSKGQGSKREQPNTRAASKRARACTPATHHYAREAPPYPTTRRAQRAAAADAIAAGVAERVAGGDGDGSAPSAISAASSASGWAVLRSFRIDAEEQQIGKQH